MTNELRNIEKMAEDYLLARNELNGIVRALNDLKPPEIPDRIESQEDYDAILSNKAAYDNLVQILWKKHTEADGAFKLAEQDLMNAIPDYLRNVWFKVEINGDIYGVAFKTDHEEIFRIIFCGWDADALPQLDK